MRIGINVEVVDILLYDTVPQSARNSFREGTDKIKKQWSTVRSNLSKIRVGTF